MKGILFITLLLLLCQLTLSCSLLSTWEKWTMERILSNQAIVVYGQQTERFLPSVTELRQDARFTVYCVLKNDDTSLPLSENIIIEQANPRGSCSGTDITTGTDVILGLRREESTGNFVYDEPHEPDGAAFKSTQEVLGNATSVCGLQEPVAPHGRSVSTRPTCPQVPAAQKEQCVGSAFTAAAQSSVVPVLSIVSCLGITTAFHWYW